MRLTVIGLSCIVLGMGSSATGSDLASKLAPMPANTWLNLGLPWKGGNEVPMCFDQAHRLFFKYGGCGDETPPVNIKFPKGDSRFPNGYSNTCWVVDMAKGDWVMVRDYDASWPADRPGNGCTRQYCYDSKRKVIWMYGSQSDGGGGFSTGDMASYDATTDKFTLANSKGPPERAISSGVGNTFAYDPIHDFLIMPRGKSTWIYKPAENAWEERKTPDGPGFQGQYGSATFDVEARRMVYPFAAGTGKTSKERQADTETTCWKYIESSKLHYEFCLETWTYDPDANKWSKMVLPANAPQPSGRWRFGLTYDSKNKVVILVGGCKETWDDTEKYYNDVWVLDTAKSVWTKMNPPGPLPGGSTSRDNRSCAYDEADNVVLWLPRRGNVWAYRYK
jgi:hypothetical protein